MEFIEIFGPEKNRTSSLGIYGKIFPNLIEVVGNLEHGSLIEPKTVQDASKLIEWLEGWIQVNKGKVDLSEDGPQRLII